MRKSDRYSQRAAARLELLPDPRYGEYGTDDDVEGSDTGTEETASVPQHYYRQPRAASSPRSVPEDFEYDSELSPSHYIPTQDDPDQFMRAPRRVAIRRNRLPESVVGRILFITGMVLALLALAALAYAIGHYLLHDDRFRLASPDAIQITGPQHIAHAQLMDAFSRDVGRNVFTIPLSDRRAALESNPWVEHATVMRLLPNRLHVAIVERKPVAFTRDGSSIGLVDANGVLMAMPHGAEPAVWSLPVVIGVTADLPLSTRAARMQIFNQFVTEIDSAGPPLSQKVSEVDLSDPDDVKALVPEDGMDVLVHFGNSGYLERFQNFEQHLPEWRAQYPNLASADMRYEGQVVLDMAPVGGSAAANSANAPAQNAAAANVVAPAPVKPQAAIAPQAAVAAPPQSAKPANRKPSATVNLANQINQPAPIVAQRKPVAAKTSSSKSKPAVLQTTTSVKTQPTSRKTSVAANSKSHGKLLSKAQIKLQNKKAAKLGTNRTAKLARATKVEASSKKIRARSATTRSRSATTRSTSATARSATKPAVQDEQPDETPIVLPSISSNSTSSDSAPATTHSKHSAAHPYSSADTNSGNLNYGGTQ